jgi:hypothetical protein
MSKNLLNVTLNLFQDLLTLVILIKNGSPIRKKMICKSRKDKRAQEDSNPRPADS